MTVAALAIATEVAVIAELAILPRKPTTDASIQKGPPNRAPRPMNASMARARDISAEPACSNIGFSCQLKATLCLMAATSQNKLPERKVTCE